MFDSGLLYPIKLDNCLLKFHFLCFSNVMLGHGVHILTESPICNCMSTINIASSSLDSQDICADIVDQGLTLFPKLSVAFPIKLCPISHASVTFVISPCNISALGHHLQEGLQLLSAFFRN